MLLPGSRGQQQRDTFYDFSGTITAGGTPQLLLPERKSTSFLFIQNISSYQMFIKFGSAKAHAVLTNGAVSSVVAASAHVTSTGELAHTFSYIFAVAVVFLVIGIVALILMEERPLRATVIAAPPARETPPRSAE